MWLALLPWVVSAPRTVQDEIALTPKLGLRNLWVDRHCIDQSDEVKEVQELATMNYIYENATSTIVTQNRVSGVEERTAAGRFGGTHLFL